MNRNYTECEDNNKRTGQSPRKCDFYDEMKATFTDSDVIQPHVLCSSRRGTKRRALDEIDVNTQDIEDHNHEETQLLIMPETTRKQIMKEETRRELEGEEALMNLTIRN